MIWSTVSVTTSLLTSSRCIATAAVPAKRSALNTASVAHNATSPKPRQSAPKTTSTVEPTDRLTREIAGPRATPHLPEHTTAGRTSGATAAGGGGRREYNSEMAPPRDRG